MRKKWLIRVLSILAAFIVISGSVYASEAPVNPAISANAVDPTAELPESSNKLAENSSEIETMEFPETSDESGTESFPDDLDTADVPNASGDSDTADVPNASGDSGAADIPDTSSDSGAADVPDTSSDSGAADVPNTSDDAYAADIPDESGVIDIPNVPAVSDTPDAPANPVESDSTVSQTKPAIPQFTIKGIFGGRSVTLNSASEGAIIYYKGGSSNITLEDASVENGGTVLFSSFYGTIYAKAYKDGQWSDAAKFILKIPVVNTPQISSAENKVTIRTSTPSAYICYTTDGSKPSWENGKRISGSGGTVAVPEGSTVRAVAVRSCFSDSGEVKLYVPVLPVAFQVKGIFGGRNVTMQSETSGAVIYYSTKTGSITTNDNTLKNGGNIDFTDFYGTVYARAYKNGKWSNVSRLILKIPKINTPTITVTDNIVTIFTTTPSCSIRYTTDGSEPTPTHGTSISGSRAVFSIPAGKTVKAIAIRSCFTSSPVVSAHIKTYDRQISSGRSGGAADVSCADQSTARWAHVMKACLYRNSDGTISVVDATDGSLSVDIYDQSFRLLNSRTITMDLPMFGGFYSGEQYNYIVFGQTNSRQDNNVVTYRVVKYNKNWQKMGTADYSGNNTTVPFSAGSLRMAEDNGYLYVRTCHEMYNGHQANVTFSVNTASMRVADELSEVWNVEGGYVSHSFNQFIAIDDGYLVGLDHGDAYPRGVILTKSPDKVNQGRFVSSSAVYSNVSLLDIPGEAGANCTGVTIGGFEVGANNYLAAINTIDHSKVTSYSSFSMNGLGLDERDVKLLLCPKNSLIQESVKEVKFTDYVNHNKLGSTPYLIKVSDNKYVVLWEEFNYEKRTDSWGWTYDNWLTQGVKYVVVDENGNKLTDIMSMSGAVLSENCQPVYMNNEITWYVNEDNGRKFFRIYIL